MNTALDYILTYIFIGCDYANDVVDYIIAFFV